MSYSFSEAIHQKSTRNAQLREKLSLAIRSSKPLSASIWDSLSTRADYESPISNLENIDIFITANEVTEKHGTGVLLKRIFKDEENIVAIRSENHYGGEQDFGTANICLPTAGLSRQEIFFRIAKLLKSCVIRRVLCIPYSQEQLRLAITVREIFNVPICTWIMDDQNITVGAIPDELMREFLAKSDLRLATHLELCSAYEEKYDLKFWILPAVAPEPLILTSAQVPVPPLTAGLLIGSIWSKRWIRLLMETVQGAGEKLDWYGQLQPSYEVSQDSLVRAGITVKGLVPETQLIQFLRTAPYFVVPTGVLDEEEDRIDIGQLSLPGRILFAMATANTPVIILGSEKTSAANFVRRFGIGTVSSYTAEGFRAAVKYINTAENQATMRHKAAAVANQFSSRGVDQWLWHSLALGKPADPRFEDLFRD